MNDLIHETLLLSRNEDGSPHLAPMGLRYRGDLVLLAPFRPSRTLDNLLRDRCASINTTDDIRHYAGCLTGHFDWPMENCEQIIGRRLSTALSHREIELLEVRDDKQRPELLCRVVHEVNHRPFHGYNRAQSAVLELAILVSRLHMLPAAKIDAEIAYLEIGLNKTAGDEERQAWLWLMDRVDAFRTSRECA